MIAAMITLAALPIFIEAARRIGARGVASALFIAFLAFLAYSLPANVGRTGEIKEAKVSAAGELVIAKQRLASFEERMAAECATGVGPKCRGWTRNVEAQKLMVAKLSETTTVAGDVGSEALSWGTAGMVPAENIRKLGILGFAIGLDIAIWSLVWFATQVVSHSSTPVPPRSDVVLPETEAAEEGPDNVTDWCQHFKSRHGRQPSIPEVQAAFPTVPKTTAWRRAKAA